MSKQAACLLALLFFPLGLLALFLIEEDEEEVCDRCEGEHEDCPWCGGF